jgi:hypothetical protein
VIEKPMINITEFVTTTRNSLLSAESFSCSRDKPDTMERYPGTSGSTHGDKNETIPARKA